MADLNLYKCKKCGWSIEAPKNGGDIVMDGIVMCFICYDCWHVFKRFFELDSTEEEATELCPNCNSYNTGNWKPNGVCPQCGGELEDKGFCCLMD